MYMEGRKYVDIKKGEITYLEERVESYILLS
jgi:hypothetical protein